MAYSVLKNSTDISDCVVACPPIPLVDSSHDNQIVLPSLTLTVIHNSVTYAKGDYIKFLDGSTAFAWFIIDSVNDIYEDNTRSLELVDPLTKLNDLYVAEMKAEDYLAATVAADFSGSYCKRFAWWDDSENPHRINFVTLSHFIKSALVKAGIVSSGALIDASDIYGSIPSGFLRWDNRNDLQLDISLEELCFQPAQIKFAKLTTGEEPYWDGATLLEVVLYALQVLNCCLRYDGSQIKILRRLTAGAPDSDLVYAYQADNWLNSFDLVNTRILYGVTAGTLDGFSNYETGAPGAGSQSNESWLSPETGPDGKKPAEKTYSLMNHSPVHYRKEIEGIWYCYEMHLEAYELGSEDQAEYLFARQFAKLLADRFPSSGLLEKFTTAADPALLGSRPLLKLDLDPTQHTSSLEY